MNRIIAGVVLVVSSVTLLATVDAATSRSRSNQSNSASGNGSMSFGEHGDSVGLIEFDVGGGDSPSGSLLFAAEDQHSYPDIIVRLDKIDRATFAHHKVKFWGDGMLHDEPVSVKVTAFDGEATDKPDTFSIKCKNGEGNLIFKADGELFSGDISIGEPS